MKKVSLLRWSVFTAPFLVDLWDWLLIFFKRSRFLSIHTSLSPMWRLGNFNIARIFFTEIFLTVMCFQRFESFFLENISKSLCSFLYFLHFNSRHKFYALIIDGVKIAYEKENSLLNWNIYMYMKDKNIKVQKIEKWRLLVLENSKDLFS